MADEKKKKADYSEFVEIAIGGVNGNDARTLKIPKKMVSSSQWNELTKVATRVVESPESAAARAAARTAAKPQTTRAMPEVDLTTPESRAAANERAARMAEEGLDLTTPESRKAAAAARMAKEGLDLTTPESRAAANERATRMAEEGLDLTTPESRKAANEQVLAGMLKRAAAARMAEEGLDLTTPESRAAAAERVAAEKEKNRVGGFFAGQGEPPSVLRPYPRQYGQAGVVDPTMADVEPSLRGQILEAVGLGNAGTWVSPLGRAAEAVSNFFSPEQAPNEQQLAAREDIAAGTAPPGSSPVSTMPDMPVGASQVTGGKVIPAGSPPGTTFGTTPGTTPGGSVSASVKTKTSKPGAAPEMQPPTVPAFDELRQARDAAIFAENAKAEAESLGYQKKVELLDKQMADAAAFEQKQTEIQLARENRMKQAQDGLMRLQSRFAELEKASPDPNRFWNSKSDGQKAMAVVAGALFGFTGQGMQWLQRLDSLVQQDVENQFADLKRQEAAVGRQVDIQNNLVSLARQQGLDDMEALNAARIMMKEKYAMQLESVAATTGSDITKAEALKKASDIRASYIKEKTALELETKRAADQAALTRAQIRKLGAETYETYASMGLKQAQAQAGGGNRPLPEAGAKLMDEYSAAVQALREMREKVKNSGVTNRIWQKFAQSDWSPGNPEEKSLKNDYDALKYQWMTLKAKGALQGVEIAKLEGLLPERGQVLSDPEKQIDAMEATAVRDFNRAVAQQEAAGFDMSRFKSSPWSRQSINFTPSR